MSHPTPSESSAAASTELVSHVEAILAKIRPAIQDDGGDVELVRVRDDRVVEVRFHGACVGCPSSGMTLQMGIERNLVDNLPEIKGVELVS